MRVSPGTILSSFGRKGRAGLAALALAGLCLADSTASRAELDLGAGFTATGSVSGTTDYLFRGISQTRNRPAAQGTLEVAHSSGLYVSAFASGANFVGGYDARQELDIQGGYRFEVASIKFDTYVIGYTYPGYTRQPGFQELAFLEVGGRGTVELGDFTLTAAVNYSPNYFGRSGAATYLEGGVDYKIPGIDVTIAGRLGYQFIERPARFGITPDSYLWYGVSASRDIAAGFSASVGFYGTDLSQRECGGLKVCDARVVGTLTWKF